MPSVGSETLREKHEKRHTACAYYFVGRERLRFLGGTPTAPNGWAFEPT